MSETITKELEVIPPWELLTSVDIKTEGAVVVVGVTEEFKQGIAKALAWMENPLETDEDFEKAKVDIKLSEETEKMLSTALDAMNNSQKSVAETNQLVKGYISSFATKRKNLKASYVSRDLAKKKEITDEGKSELKRVLNLTSVANIFRIDTQAIDNAIKSKRKYLAMTDAVNSVVVDQISAIAWMESMYNKNIILIAESSKRYPGINPDVGALAIMPTDMLILKLAEREATQALKLKEQKEEAGRKAKIESDRLAKVEADRLAKIAADRPAEESRITDPMTEPNKVDPEPTASFNFTQTSPPPSFNFSDIIPDDPFSTATFSPSSRPKIKFSDIPEAGWKDLYHKVNIMMLRLGADGEINATQDEVCDVMSALADIDGGTYDNSF